MYIFGHLGFGVTATHWVVSKKFLTESSRSDVPMILFGWALIGCILPDLIDKPLHILNTSLGLDFSVIVGDRSIGHSIFLCLIAFILSRFTDNLVLLPISIGCFSHICLDFISDSVAWWVYITPGSIPLHSFGYQQLASYFWPIVTKAIGQSPQTTINDYWVALFNPILISYEIVGILLFIRASIKYRFSPVRWLSNVIKF